MKNLSRRQFIRLGGYACFLGLVASYPIFIERTMLMVNTYRIPVPNLPPIFNGFRIIHLTDLHHGILVPLDHIHRIIKQTNQLERDIIVCTGDYVHEWNSTKQIDSVWPIMANLHAPHGVYSVLGNHDHWADSQRSLFWLEQTGQDARHKVMPIEKQGSRLWLVGAGDLWEDHICLDTLLSQVPESDCRIVLAHNPDSADSQFTSRMDLMISGHTHGGQVNIPFIGTPVLPVKNKTYSNGLKLSKKGHNVFISRGTGWAILPIRFNCHPEIAILELTPAIKDTA